MLRVCGALLRDHRTTGAGARCAGLPVPGIGYCETCGRYPTPFFRRCVCERRILSASCPGCRAGALCPGCRSCYACIGCVCISLGVGIACGVWPIWLLRYVLPLAAVYTTLRPYICRCSHCARCGYAARCASYMLPMCVYIAQAPALDHVQRERLRYVMRLFCRSCVQLRVLLRVRAMRADILPRRCQ